MKKILAAALALAFSGAQAQYFEHVYGTKQFEEVSSGMNTVLTGPGFLLGGTRTSTNGNVGISMLRTDINGNAAVAPYFKNNYAIYFNSGLNPIMRVRQAFVTELSATRFGIAGVCYKDLTLRKLAVYYAQVDQFGNTLPGPTYNMKYYDTGLDAYYQVRNIRLSNSGNELYVVGITVNNTTGIYYTMVLKIDVATGNLLWSNNYRVGSSVDEGAYDAYENPATNELVVVGYVSFGGDYSGYLFRINATTGGIVTGSSTLLYNSGVVSNEYLTCIAPSMTGGYDIGGWTTMSGNQDSWLLQLDNAFNLTNSTRLDYSNSQANNYAIDIMERPNGLGQREVYVAGQTVTGLLGGADIEVYKYNTVTGACQQFTYGNNLYDYVSSIDQRNTGVSDGMSLFGLTTIVGSQFANNDFCIYKSYFNGISSCNFDVRSMFPNPGPNVTTLNAHAPSSIFYASPCWLQLAGNFADTMICFSSTVPAGSNFRAAEATGIRQLEGDDTPQVMQDRANHTLSVTNIVPRSTLQLFDLSGRAVAVEPRVSENEAVFDLSGMPGGVYLLRVQGPDGRLFSHKLVKD